MDSDLTLSSLEPHIDIKQKLYSGVILIITAAVLISSYIWTGISPFKLYEKRGNAWSYLFGKDVTEEDKNDAMERAKRYPKIVVMEDARVQIKSEFEEQNKPLPGFMEMQRLMDDKTEIILSQMDNKTKDKIIQKEYEKILKDKKGGYFPPDTEIHNITGYLKSLVETIAMAIWGTIFALIFAIPASFFAAKNTLALIFQGESRLFSYLRGSLYFLARRCLDFCRGFNEFVMALILVAVIGLGPFAGILALAVHTFGILGKVFSESVEAVDNGEIEGVLASGASPFQVIRYGVLPQIMPTVVSYTLLRFESNVRSATILGFVGAGGIGFLMYDKINGYMYREVCTMMIIVILTVTVIDYLCGKMRRKFI
jgi:phosphonate transport system permease protein